MINFVKNVYNSPDLHGDFLVAPLRSYHAFSAEKMHSGSWLAKSALVVAGIFAYSVLGAVATVGMLIKLTGIPSIRSHNEKTTQRIKSFIIRIKNASSQRLPYVSRGSNTFIGNYQLSKHFSFIVDYIDVEEPRIINGIKECTEKFRNVYAVNSVTYMQANPGGLTTLTGNVHLLVAG